MFSRNARLFLAGTFFFGFGVGTFWVLLNLYFRSLGLPEGSIGAVLSSQSLGTVLMAIPASLLAGRLKLKWLLVLAALLAAAGFTLLVTLPPSYWLRVAAALAGAAFTVHHVIAAPFFMRNSTSRERIYLFGINWAVEILASVIGVLGGGWLAAALGTHFGSDMLGLRVTLLVATGLLALSVVPYLFIRSPAPAPDEAMSLKFWRLKNPGLLARLVAPGFLVGMGAGLIIPFLNLYFRDRFTLETDEIGRVFAVAQALTALGFLVGPAVAKRFGMIQTVVTAEILSIPFFLILAFTGRLELAVVAFWLRGALMNMNHPISRNFAMEAVEPEQHAFTNAILELSWSIAWMISTQLGGWIIEHHGFSLPMLITVGLYLVSSLLYLGFFHDYERKILIPKREAALAEEAAVAGGHS